MKTRIFGIVVIVLLLLVGTNETFAQTEIQKKSETPSRELQQEKVIKSKTQSQLLVWQKRLGLSDEQVSELEVVMEEYVGSIQSLKADKNLSNDEKKAQAATIRKEYDVKFREYLTEAQKEKLDKLKDQREASKAKRQDLKGK